MKKIRAIMTIIAISTCLSIPVRTTAQNPSNDYEIIPKASSGGKVEAAVKAVGEEGGSVRDTYSEKAEELNTVGDQMASGIMTWDTLLDYIVYLVRFLSQIGIVIGVVMIIYAGYLYASSVFSPGNMTKGKTALTNAIIGVLVVAFSYAIMKLLTSAFLS